MRRYHPGYWYCTKKGHPQEPIEPQFKPEGEPDEYRDDYESLLGSITRIVLYNEEMETSVEYAVDLDGRHILAYLSETENNA